MLSKQFLCFHLLPFFPSLFFFFLILPGESGGDQTDKYLFMEYVSTHSFVIPPPPRPPHGVAIKGFKNLDVNFLLPHN